MVPKLSAVILTLFFSEELPLCIEKTIMSSAPAAVRVPLQQLDHSITRPYHAGDKAHLLDIRGIDRSLTLQLLRLLPARRCIPQDLREAATSASTCVGANARGVCARPAFLDLVQPLPKHLSLMQNRLSSPLVVCFCHSKLCPSSFFHARHCSQMAGPQMVSSDLHLCIFLRFVCYVIFSVRS